MTDAAFPEPPTFRGLGFKNPKTKTSCGRWRGRTDDDGDAVVHVGELHLVEAAAGVGQGQHQRPTAQVQPGQGVQEVCVLDARLQHDAPTNLNPLSLVGLTPPPRTCVHGRHGVHGEDAGRLEVLLPSPLATLLNGPDSVSNPLAGTAAPRYAELLPLAQEPGFIGTHATAKAPDRSPCLPANSAYSAAGSRG